MKMCVSKENNGMESSLIQILRIVRESHTRLMQVAVYSAQGLYFVYFY